MAPHVLSRVAALIVIVTVCTLPMAAVERNIGMRENRRAPGLTNALKNVGLFVLRLSVLCSDGRLSAM